MYKKTITFICIVMAAGCAYYWLRPSDTDGHPRDWDEIMESGELHVVTEYNPTGYFMDGDTLKGFNYELIQSLGKTYGLEVTITPEMDRQKQYEGVKNGKYDLIATGLLITPYEMDTLITYSKAIYVNKQVLVQRSEIPDDSTGMYVHTLFELAKKTIYLPKGSAAVNRIHNLCQEMADTIITKEIPRYGTEQLMAMVAHGDIDYAMCEANLAKAARKHISGLDTKKEVSFNQFYAWGIYRECDETIKYVDLFLNRFKDCQAYKDLIKKYGLTEAPY